MKRGTLIVWLVSEVSLVAIASERGMPLTRPLVEARLCLGIVITSLYPHNAGEKNGCYLQDKFSAVLFSRSYGKRNSHYLVFFLKNSFSCNWVYQ